MNLHSVQSSECWHIHIAPLSWHTCCASDSKMHKAWAACALYIVTRCAESLHMSDIPPSRSIHWPGRRPPVYPLPPGWWRSGGPFLCLSKHMPFPLKQWRAGATSVPGPLWRALGRRCVYGMAAPQSPASLNPHAGCKLLNCRA